MAPRRSRTLISLAGLALAWAVLATAGSLEGLASIVPLLALLAPLLLMRFPGERRIASLRALVRGRRSRERPVDSPPPALRRPVLARGGLLLARSLAVRPPPPAPARA